MLSEMSETATAAPPRQHAFEIADQLSRAFAQTARRTRPARGHGKTERDLLRASGLLNLIIPSTLGGWGMDWPDTMKLIRLFARVDSSIAHLFGFQHLMLASVSLYGSLSQTEWLFSETVRNKWFWGNALNPLDRRTILSADQDIGYIIDGRKSFCSGAVDSDMLIVSGIRAEDQKFMVAAIPSDRPGIRIHEDWDSIGQRQTDSGTVEFLQVPAAHEEFLTTPGPLGSIRASLRSCIAQLILSNIFLGLAEGALAEARDFTLAQTRPWANSSRNRDRHRGSLHPREVRPFFHKSPGSSGPHRCCWRISSARLGKRRFNHRRPAWQVRVGCSRLQGDYHQDGTRHHQPDVRSDGSEGDSRSCTTGPLLAESAHAYAARSSRLQDS